MDTQRHLYIKHTRKSTRKMCSKNLKDPSAALGHPKMASEDAAARDRSQERSHAGYARAAEPDAGIPGHVGTVKQLHSGTGYNLVIDTEGKVYGTREPYNEEAIMEVTARDAGEIQIKGQKSKFYLAMDEKGKIYAEIEKMPVSKCFVPGCSTGYNSERKRFAALGKKVLSLFTCTNRDQESSNTWFKEMYEDGWNYYVWLGNNKQWFLGINKSGKMKQGHKTKKKQKSVKFVPRTATPSYN